VYRIRLLGLGQRMIVAPHRFVWIISAQASLLMAQMASLPGGTFTMGGDTGEPNEAPAHRVTLSSFLIDKTEVTFAAYDSCVAAGRCTPAHYDDGACVIWTNEGFRNVRVPRDLRNARYPVVCVTWFQAQAYCQAKGKRLPTEAQWEYAAGAGQGATYSWGDSPPSAARCAQPPATRPEKVASFEPNPWGLYDMTGNVWEWTADHYSPDYYAASPQSDPPGAEVGQYRTIRGGGWYCTPSQLRIKNRHWFEPNFGEVSIGFRCTR
jgi:formylglycine-generating enzyme required for sulfatase activity